MRCNGELISILMDGWLLTQTWSINFFKKGIHFAINNALPVEGLATEICRIGSQHNDDRSWRLGRSAHLDPHHLHHQRKTIKENQYASWKRYHLHYARGICILRVSVSFHERLIPTESNQNQDWNWKNTKHKRTANLSK